MTEMSQRKKTAVNTFCIFLKKLRRSTLQQVRYLSHKLQSSKSSFATQLWHPVYTEFFNANADFAYIKIVQ